MLDVAVLLSVGRHPASGRSRAAERDRQALEIGLRLLERTRCSIAVEDPGGSAGASQLALPAGLSAVRLHAIHAGNPSEPALRSYLGMGLSEIGVLDVEEGADPLPALIEHLFMLRPALVLSGPVSERGESSGYLPYAIAKALDYAVVSNVVALTTGEDVEVLQALPRGQRRRIQSALPLVATIDRAAPSPRAAAYAKAQRGRIVPMLARSLADRERALWNEGPARQRPKRIAMASGSAAERLKLATETQAGKGRLLVDPRPEDAAREILDFLATEGLFPISRRGA